MGLPAYILNQFPSEMREAMNLFGEWIYDHAVRREDFTELKNIVADLAVAQKDLAEAQKRTEARVEELAEAQKRTEARVEELAEAQKRTEARVEDLAEAQNRTEARLQELSEEMRLGFKEMRDQISALGSRWGIQNEQTFRNTIEGLFGTMGYTIRRGNYGGREVDVVIRNGEHILLEVTARLHRKDVPLMNRSADDYRVREGVDPRLMVAAIYVHPAVMKELRTSQREIEIFTSDEE